MVGFIKTPVAPRCSCAVDDIFSSRQKQKVMYSGELMPLPIPNKTKFISFSFYEKILLSAAWLLLSGQFLAQAQTDYALQHNMIWTEATPSSEGEPIFVAFRKTFALNTQPTAAELRIFADLRYQLWVNGRYVMRGLVRFDPKTPQFDVVNLASYLQPGANTLAVLVLGRANNNAMMRHAPGLAAELRFTDSVGKVTFLKTDKSWRWNDKTAYGSPASLGGYYRLVYP